MEDDYADENATESIGGQLIVRNSVGYNVVDRQAPTERHPDSDSDSNTPYSTHCRRLHEVFGLRRCTKLRQFVVGLVAV